VAQSHDKVLALVISKDSSISLGHRPEKLQISNTHSLPYKGIH
jgi:hypothetical protein